MYLYVGKDPPDDNSDFQTVQTHFKLVLYLAITCCLLNSSDYQPLFINLGLPTTWDCQFGMNRHVSDYHQLGHVSLRQKRPHWLRQWGKMTAAKKKKYETWRFHWWHGIYWQKQVKRRATGAFVLAGKVEHTNVFFFFWQGWCVYIYIYLYADGYIHR